MSRYVGVNCSKCGRWVGADGFLDVYMDTYNGSALELGDSLCKRCLDARCPTIYDLEAEIRELNATDTSDAKEHITNLEKQIETIRGQIR